MNLFDNFRWIIEKMRADMIQPRPPVQAAMPIAPAWIPVAERLPEQGQHVLVWWRDSAATPDGLPWPTKFLRGDFHDPVYGAALGQVTYWMSLPAPPDEVPASCEDCGDNLDPGEPRAKLCDRCEWAARQF